MTTLLQIDSSARTPRSHTRRLTLSFVQEWLARAPETRVIYRDLGSNPPRRDHRRVDSISVHHQGRAQCGPKGCTGSLRYLHR